MHLNPSPTELTTAATDVALGLFCVVLLMRLRHVPGGTAWKKATWASVFRLTVLASALGAVAHGLALAEWLRDLLWLPLYLSLGLAVAVFLVGATADWRDESTARAVLPWAVGCGAAFFVVSQLLNGAFVVFVAYEAVAVLIALAMYLELGATGRLPGAGLISVGIVLSLMAAALQVSRASIRVIVPFDHNGLFHVVQMIAIAVIASGVRRGWISFATR